MAALANEECEQVSARAPVAKQRLRSIFIFTFCGISIVVFILPASSCSFFTQRNVLLKWKIFFWDAK